MSDHFVIMLYQDPKPDLPSYEVIGSIDELLERTHVLTRAKIKYTVFKFGACIIDAS